MESIPHLLNNVDLHPGNKTWTIFLKKYTKLIDIWENNEWFCSSNCPYFVDKYGYIKQLYGWHGYAYWMSLTGKDHNTVYNQLWDK